MAGRPAWPGPRPVAGHRGDHGGGAAAGAAGPAGRRHRLDIHGKPGKRRINRLAAAGPGRPPGLGIPAPAQRAHAVIYTANYGEAAAINNLGRNDGLPAAVSDDNNEWWWGPGNPRATTVIAVANGPAGGGTGTAMAGFFTNVEQVATLSNPAGIHNQEWGGHIYLCTGPTMPWPQLWPLLRHYG